MKMAKVVVLLAMIVFITTGSALAQRSVDDAIGWAHGQISSNDTDAEHNRPWHGWCMHFCGHTYGFTSSGFDDANAGWNSTSGTLGEKHLDKNFNAIPRGALVFFDLLSTGHVGLSIGDGKMIHAWTTGVVESSIGSSTYSSSYRGWRWPNAWTNTSYSELNSKCKGDVCWEPQSSSCENANSWYILKDPPYADRASSSVCGSINQQVTTISQASNPNEKVPEQQWWQSWWRSLKSLLGPTASAAGIQQFTVDRKIFVVNNKTVSIISGNGLTPSDSYGLGSIIAATDSTQQGKPDFVVDKLWLETSGGTEKYEFSRSDEIKIRMDLKNIGDDDVPAGDEVETRIYLSDGYRVDPSDNWILIGKEYPATADLDPGETDSQTEYMRLWEFDTIKYGKIYNIVACIDRIHDQNNGSGEFAEKHENNNCSTEAVFKVGGQFNFTVQSIALGGGKTSLITGDPFSLDVVAKNIGEDSPMDIKVSYYISGGSLGAAPVFIGVDNIQEVNFKAGVLKSETLEQSFAPNISGQYVLAACVDYGNKIEETNEDDNCLSMNVQVNNLSPNPAHKKTTTPVLQLLFAE